MGTKRRRSSEDSQERSQKSVKSDSTSVKLACLLDLTDLTTLPDLSTRFDEIANALFFDVQLSLGHGDQQTEFDILELEFYLKKEDCHQDPFTHGSEEQNRSGQWYFHRAPRRDGDIGLTVQTSAGGYRGGTRKGLDLTFSGPVRSPYFIASTPSNQRPLAKGGILLRTIRRVSDSKVISGPSLLVDEILRLSNASSISELVTRKWAGDLTAFPVPSSGTLPSDWLRLQPKTNTSGASKPTVYRSPRIGLELSHSSTKNTITDPRVVYVSKPYRYFIHPNLLTSNGRAHTFLGVYRACRDSGRHDSNNDAGLLREVVELTGISERTVIKYLGDFKSGVDHGRLESFIGTAGKGVSASMPLFLKMMGTLERVLASNTQHLAV